MTVKNRKSILDYYGEINGSFLHAHGEVATEQLIQELDIQGNEKMFEFGFGTGATLVKIKARYPRVSLFGTERSEFMLRSGLARMDFCGIEDVQLKLSDPQNRLEFPDNTFDKIYVEGALAIQEKAELEIIIKELRRVLKPGGKMVMNETVWVDGIPAEEIERINKICREEFGIMQATGQYKTRAEWATMLGRSGFKVVKHEEAATRPVEIKRSYKELRSRAFTLKGKVSGKLNSRLRNEFEGYKQIMDGLYEKKYLEGSIISAYKQE
jgi:ubiquinone/menaquinone biosynthesis C-methylase UbiE